MNWLLTTDTHLGHDKMREYCERPIGFEETILSKIAHFTHTDDVLIHLGDVCVYRDEYWNARFLEANNGKSWLIKGNHDRKSNSWYLAQGWDFVAESISLRMFGLNILLSHKPVQELSGIDINVHGHGHITAHHPEIETNSKHKLLFIEHEYTPFNLRKVVNK